MKLTVYDEFLLCKLSRNKIKAHYEFVIRHPGKWIRCQMKTPQNAPKNQNDELTRWLQFLRDDINNMNRTIEDLRQEVEKLKAKG
jgi:hypothetical protein